MGKAARRFDRDDVRGASRGGGRRGEATLAVGRERQAGPDVLAGRTGSSLSGSLRRLARSVQQITPRRQKLLSLRDQHLGRVGRDADGHVVDRHLTGPERIQQRTVELRVQDLGSRELLAERPRRSSTPSFTPRDLPPGSF